LEVFIIYFFIYNITLLVLFFYLIMYIYIYIFKKNYNKFVIGAIFGDSAIALVIILSSVGASFCYFLSKICLGSLLNYYADEKIKSLEIKIKQNEGNLFFYLLFIRLFPITPNW